MSDAWACPMETFGFGDARAFAAGELSRRMAPTELSRRAAPELEAPRAPELEAPPLGWGLVPRTLACAFALAMPAPAAARGDWRLVPPRLAGLRMPGAEPAAQVWQVMAPDEVEKAAFPMTVLHVAQTTHSGWKEPRAHFTVPPAMTSPHAAHFCPKRVRKQGVQYAAFACTLKPLPVSCSAHALHLKHSACSLPPSCSTSTTLPPLIGSLHTGHVPSDHCVVALDLALAITSSDILKGPLCLRARMNMSFASQPLANSIATTLPNVQCGP
mmetsp:Transcript_2713/g.6344  ORF Transcript_2713/g.6344 Transcript_2713/m.6344 type:complete len:271 (+) Transcript_2713:101-913(+)